MNSKYQTWIAYVTAGIVLFLACSAFVLSYESLRLLALQNGIDGWLSFLWPLTLDAVMIAVSMNILYRSITGQRSWYQWFLVVFFTAASIAYNAIHAPSTWLARSIYAFPPTVVFIAFELLANQVKFSVTRQGAMESLKTVLEARARCEEEVRQLNKQADELASRNSGAEKPQLQPVQEPVVSPPTPKRAVRKAVKRSTYYEPVIAELSANPDISIANLAQRIGVTRPTMYNIVGDLSKQGLISRNGKAHKKEGVVQ